MTSCPCRPTHRSVHLRGTMSPETSQTGPLYTYNHVYVYLPAKARFILWSSFHQHVWQMTRTALQVPGSEKESPRDGDPWLPSGCFGTTAAVCHVFVCSRRSARLSPRWRTWFLQCAAIIFLFTNPATSE